ncbi:PadR family transcriptional regulator [Rhodococcus sp. RD6.2]|jgi:DNA-binding PadR family transcriptional regulator|uniref:PadR family transcriptional regulator n=1 Tax=Rhodococcus sp. RD6.2 TaxID=260936 RepID=UPI00063B19BD|nr:PadR family transcriptional regulator [Rhodococcus sp. RD6.2]CRK49880.1 PadR family transcriptional regulator [Rhodococcus sp. RD6.2]
MALQDAILAALTTGEYSGYDLAKSFDVTVANFWTATPQQLYRELDKMQEAGLIVARTVEQEKRPNKRMYTLTEAGRTALRDFASRSPKPTAIRDELLVQVEAMDTETAPAVRANVQRMLEASEAKLERYEKRREYLLAGRTENAFLADGVSIGSYLTLTRGIAFEAENVRWCEFVLAAVPE